MGSRSSSITDAKPGDVVDIEIDWRFFDLGCLRIDDARREGDLYASAGANLAKQELCRPSAI
jgi:hypothetical protein